MLEACALHLHMLAYHAEPGFESFVPGIGVLCDTPIDDTRFAAGVFRNSIRKTSAYAGFVWQPIHIGQARIGGMAGLVSGYYRGIEPLGAFVVSMPLAEKTEGHAAFIPKIAGKTPATVQFSISIGF